MCSFESAANFFALKFTNSCTDLRYHIINYSIEICSTQFFTDLIGQPKFDGSVLCSSQFTLLPQLPLKATLDLKVEKIDTKIIISLC